MSSGQITLEAQHYRPTGEIGDIMKPTVAFELSYCNDFNGFVRARAGVHIASLKTRLDTLPIYSTVYDGQTTVVPGFQYFETYRVNTIAVGADFRFFKHDKINPYIGLDATFGYIRFRYTYSSATSFGTDMGNLVHYGIRPRIGFEYHITDNIAVFTQVARNWYMVRYVGGQGYNSYGLGLRYII